jgi:hypothetical protein
MAHRHYWGCILAVLLGCGEPMGAPESTIRVLPMSPLVLGETRKVVFEDEAYAEEQWRWRSADERVASVSWDGRIEGRLPGTTVVSGRLGEKSVRIPVSVASAQRAWSAPLPLQRKTFLTVASNGVVFAKTVADPGCDWLCFGEVFVLDAAGKPVADWKGIRRIAAGNDRAWLEGNGALLEFNYASALSTAAPMAGNLLGLFADGELLLSAGNDLVRYAPGGEEKARWNVGGNAQHAVIRGDDVFASGTGSLIHVKDGSAAALIIDGPQTPWGADGSNGLLLTDLRTFAFALYRPFAELQILDSRYSVLVSKRGLVESEGLSAVLSVPVASTSTGQLFVEMHTFGAGGVNRSFDVVFRSGSYLHWRWGPSVCTDHPFAVAVIPGAALVSSCDRIVRIDDKHIVLEGPWPQPGGDAGRSWRTQ